MIYRIFVESKPGTNPAANNLLNQIREFLNIKTVEKIRIINRYDVEGIEKEVFDRAVTNIFAQPPIDNFFQELKLEADEKAFAVSFLPGQFDQRADSAAMCIQMLSQVEKPNVIYSCVYIVKGNVNEADFDKIKNYLINPVEAHEVSMDIPKSLEIKVGEAATIPVLEGFIDYNKNKLLDYLDKNQCAMDFEDIKLVQEYFKSKDRNPTETELKVIDTYWSDHCRHTTFNTELKNIEIEDEDVKESFNKYLEIKEKVASDKPITLMNMGTIVAKYLKSEGKLKQLDESDEINACTIKVDVDVDGASEKWLLLFKNETHNHPTEIEPFGGAATCIGGAIRDPLSGRAYVYAAMRVTGAANPLEKHENIIEGKLPQRKIVKTACDGYSSYGNQIGIATSFIDEFYHPSYVAKRLEIGAVLGAVKQENVQRSKPQAGDLIILVGGATGRDGIGGATGSSKAHDVSSVDECGAQVQKGNAIEERKLQRLFRNPQVAKIIKKCNDFGAGGVSVAIGELADGLNINLDAVYKKYEGLNATELAISESQERMAIVIAKEDLEKLQKFCHDENIKSAVVAQVVEEPILRMVCKGQEVVNIDRAFLDTNGAKKEADVFVKKSKKSDKANYSNLKEGLKTLVNDLNHCGKRGLIEQFDSTIGASTVLMPLGGKHQSTPSQAMVHKLPVLNKETKTCSFMAYGFNPNLAAVNPYESAYQAVIDSVCKIIASGCDLEQIHLSFQEYFPSLKKDAEKWGLPLASLMGAFKAQMDLEIASIGGKDSMSGSFEDIDVIPTLVSFAVSVGTIDKVISPELKKAGNKLYLVKGEKIDKDYLRKISSLIHSGKVVSAYSLTNVSPIEAIFKMALGNRLGAKLSENFDYSKSFENVVGGFLLETNEKIEGELIAEVIEEYKIISKDEEISIAKLEKDYDNYLEPVYTSKVDGDKNQIEKIDNTKTYEKYTGEKIEKPKVLISVFPGTNCEYDSQRAWVKAGAEVETVLIRNLNVKDIEDSIEEFASKLKKSQILFIPGGFSGGDEPDGSAKFITSFMRNQKVKKEITDLIENRQGLIGGICNGFQALIKLGLLPYGKIVEPREDMPTLCVNTIKRHQSKIVNIRISNSTSPWLRKTNIGEIYQVPISHGEGRILGKVDALNVATQYVDFEGNPTSDISFNPNNSYKAIEGMISDNGRIFGKMGHAERISDGCYKNVYGKYDMKIFESAVDYFKK